MSQPFIHFEWMIGLLQTGDGARAAELGIGASLCTSRENERSAVSDHDAADRRLKADHHDGGVAVLVQHRGEACTGLRQRVPDLIPVGDDVVAGCDGGVGMVKTSGDVHQPNAELRRFRAHRAAYIVEGAPLGDAGSGQQLLKLAIRCPIGPSPLAAGKR